MVFVDILSVLWYSGKVEFEDKTDTAVTARAGYALTWCVFHQCFLFRDMRRGGFLCRVVLFV